MQLSDRVIKTILQEVRTGRYRDAERLPSEVEMAAELGVSRTVLRDALTSLEREGFISRKHGVGTIINRHVLAVKTRMDLEEEFLSMVRTAGKTPRETFCESGVLPASGQVAARLGIEPGSPVIQVARLITADGEPAIYCVDSFSTSLIRKPNYDMRVLESPVFNFLSVYCDVEVYMDLTEVRAVAASAEQALRLGVAEGSPLLFMDEVGYDFQGHPVLSSMEYYRDQVLHHTVLRKKI